jgi:hypothetical protein
MVTSAGCTMMAIPHLVDYVRFYWEIVCVGDGVLPEVTSNLQGIAYTDREK